MKHSLDILVSLTYIMENHNTFFILIFKGQLKSYLSFRDHFLILKVDDKRILEFFPVFERRNLNRIQFIIQI
jgi:hypothetical protein